MVVAKDLKMLIDVTQELPDRDVLHDNTQETGRKMSDVNHYCVCELKAKVKLKTLGTFLLIFCLVGFLTLLRVAGRFYNTRYGQTCYEGGWSERRVCNTTYTYVPAIDYYYQNSTAPITMYSPTTYEILQEGQMWHFDAITSNDTSADVAIFVPSSVQYLKLILQSPFAMMKTTYNLSLSSPHRVRNVDESALEYVKISINDSKIPTFAERVNVAGTNFTVVNVSDYVTQWVNGPRTFSLKAETSTTFNNANEELASLQPVVCFHHLRSKPRDDEYLQGVLRRYLIKGIMNKDPYHWEQQESLRSDREKRSPVKKRGLSSANRECQMYELEVNLEDLGLIQVIHPTKVYLKYCLGRCHILDGTELFSINALLRAKYRILFGGNRVPSPQCTPTHFRYLSFVINDKGQAKRVGVYDLDATTCGCR